MHTEQHNTQQCAKKKRKKISSLTTDPIATHATKLNKTAKKWQRKQSQSQQKVMLKHHKYNNLCTDQRDTVQMASEIIRWVHLICLFGLTYSYIKEWWWGCQVKGNNP